MNVNTTVLRQNAGLSLDAPKPAVPVRQSPATARIPIPVRWCLYLFAFALPFEVVPLPIVTGLVSVPRVSGALFFAVYVLYYGPLTRRRLLPRLSAATACFMGYVFVFSLHAFVLAPEYRGQFVERAFTLVQLILLLWIASGLLRNETVSKHALLAFALATALVSVGNLLQVPGFYSEYEPGRITALGDNPNDLACNAAISSVALAGLWLYGRYNFVKRTALLLLLIPLVPVMISTGSRGMLVAFVAGIVVYAIPVSYSKKVVTQMAITAVLIAGVAYEVSKYSDVVERWEQTLNSGSMAGREEIFPTAAGMITERPIEGWGPVQWFYELGRRLSVPSGKDAHNLWLGLLMEVGILGTIPFLAGICWCFRSAWRARTGHLGCMPLALLVSILVAGLSSNTLIAKTQWLLIAFAIAAPNQVQRGRTVTNSQV